MDTKFDNGEETIYMMIIEPTSLCPGLDNNCPYAKLKHMFESSCIHYGRGCGFYKAKKDEEFLQNINLSN